MADFPHSAMPHPAALGAIGESGPKIADDRFRKILNELPAAIYTTDAMGHITYFNEAAARLWGERPKLGESEWCGSWKLFWPDGTVLPHGECSMARAIKERRTIWGMETIAQRTDGTRVPFIPYPTPLFDADGVLIGAVNMLVDITDRKQGEEMAQRLAAIVESSDDAIVTKDLNGIIKTWNKGAERIFGYTAEEVVGQSVSILIPENQKDEEPAILARIRKGERIDHYETVRQRKDGGLLNISLTVSPVRGIDGKILGASKIARDITEIKRERQLRELLLREMDHRVKNLFALANAVVAISARSAGTPRELVHAVGERLGALASAHALTLPNPSEDGGRRSTTLHALIGTVVAAYNEQTDSGQPRIRIAGIDVPVADESLTGLALLLHEFTTNAAKYGALSLPSGRLEITVTGDDDKVLLTWLERGGPPINGKIGAEGFGSVLARMTVTGQLGGTIERDWQPEGLCIRLSASRAKLASRPADA